MVWAEGVIMKKTLMALLLILPQTLTAEGVTGNELYTTCTSEDPNHDYICFTYITGVFEGWTLTGMDDIISFPEGHSFVPDLLNFCAPVGYTRQQMVDVVIKYLEEHPEARHDYAAKLILEAHQQVFPCDSGD